MYKYFFYVPCHGKKENIPASCAGQILCFCYADLLKMGNPKAVPRKRDGIDDNKIRKLGVGSVVLGN